MTRRFPRITGSALMTWHGFAPNRRTSSMDVPRQHSHSRVQKVASLLKRMRLSEVRVLPIRPSIASAQSNISRVFHFQKAHPMKVASVKQYYLCSSKRTGVQSLLLQISSTVHWHKQTIVHSWLKARP